MMQSLDVDSLPVPWPGRLTTQRILSLKSINVLQKEPRKMKMHCGVLDGKLMNINDKKKKMVNNSYDSYRRERE